MARQNLGRVQGGGIYISTESSTDTVLKTSITPTDIVPRIGDSILFSDSILRTVISVEATTICCSEVEVPVVGQLATFRIWGEE